MSQNTLKELIIDHTKKFIDKENEFFKSRCWKIAIPYPDFDKFTDEQLLNVLLIFNKRRWTNYSP